MGEATYYLKARIPGLTDDKVEEIREFFAEGYRASEFWHGHRDGGPQDFWPDFKAKFPLVSDYLAELLDSPDNNALAGILDFGLEEGQRLEDTVWSEGDWLYASAYVWHFASWDRLLAFLKTKWGAVEGGWLSDEYAEIDYFGMIELSALS